MAATDVVSQQKLLKIHLQVDEGSPKILNTLQSGEAAMFATLDLNKNLANDTFPTRKRSNPSYRRTHIFRGNVCSNQSNEGLFVTIKGNQSPNRNGNKITQIKNHPKQDMKDDRFKL